MFFFKKQTQPEQPDPRIEELSKKLAEAERKLGWAEHYKMEAEAKFLWCSIDRSRLIEKAENYKNSIQRYIRQGPGYEPDPKILAQLEAVIERARKNRANG